MATHSNICQENALDRGAWQATVGGVAKSPMQLSACRGLTASRRGAGAQARVPWLPDASMNVSPTVGPVHTGGGTGP